MSPLWIIGMREFRTRVLTWTFWMSTLGFPVVGAGLMFAMVLLGGSEPTRLGVVVPEAGMFELLDRRLPDRSFSASVVESEAAGVEQIRAGKLDGVLVVAPSTLADGDARYLAKKALRFERQTTLDDRVRSFVLRRILIESGRDPNAVLRGEVEFEDIDPASKTDTASKRATPVVEMVTGYCALFVIFMMTGIYPLMMLQAVSEEQQTGLVEVLLSSALPRDVLGGKLLGLLGMAVVQVGLWVSTMVAIVVIPLGLAGQALPDELQTVVAGMSGRVDDLLFAGVCAVLSFVLYALLAALLGVFCQSKQQAEQMQMVVLFPPMIGSTIAGMALMAPDTLLATASSFFPMMAPAVLATRYTAGAPLWEIAVGFVILVASVVVAFRFVVRLYPLAALGVWRPKVPFFSKGA